MLESPFREFLFKLQKEGKNEMILPTIRSGEEIAQVTHPLKKRLKEVTGGIIDVIAMPPGNAAVRLQFSIRPPQVY